MKVQPLSASIMVKFIGFLVLLPFLGTAQKADFDFTYQVDVQDLPKDAESFSMVLPVPESDKYQMINNLTFECDHSYTLEQESQFNNKYLRLNLKGADIPKNLSLTMEFNVMRKAIEEASAYKRGSEAIKRHVKSDSLIPLNNRIRNEANKALEGEQDKEAQVKAFYDYLINTMTYDKSGEGWGKGDAIYACNAKKGNCTDFHSLFMGMCRTQKIPTRFQIGFPVPAEKPEATIHGYHCWAEFFLPEQGWAPVDISEASKNEAKREYYFGNLDANRVNFSTGRDIPVKVNEKDVKVLNYFIYPRVFVDNQPYGKVETQFHFDNNE